MAPAATAGDSLLPEPPDPPDPLSLLSSFVKAILSKPTSHLSFISAFQPPASSALDLDVGSIASSSVSSGDTLVASLRNLTAVCSVPRHWICSLHDGAQAEPRSVIILKLTNFFMSLSRHIDSNCRGLSSKRGLVWIQSLVDFSIRAVSPRRFVTLASFFYQNLMWIWILFNHGCLVFESSRPVLMSSLVSLILRGCLRYFRVLFPAAASNRLQLVSPILPIPQVYYTSSADSPSLVTYRTREEHVDLVLWIVAVDRLYLMNLVTCLAFVGSFTALVRILAAVCRPCFIYAQWPLSLVFIGCDFSMGLVGIEDCYVNMDGVTTLPCIEVCFKQVIVTHFAKGSASLISYDVYYLEVVCFANLFQSFLAYRYVAAALVVNSLALKKVIISPKVPLAMSGFVAQDSSVLQGSSSRHCLSSAYGAGSLALLAVENLALLLASGELRDGVHEAFEILFDVGSLLGSAIKWHSLSILVLDVVTICMVFGWASIAFCWVFVTFVSFVCISSSLYGV